MLERPFGEIEAHHRADSEQPDLLTGVQRLDAGGHDDLAGVQPCETATVAGSMRSTSTFRSDTVRLDGSTTQTAGWPIELGQSSRRNLDRPARLSSSMRPRRWHRAASPPVDRQADLDLECPGDRIGLRGDLPDAADRRNRWDHRQAHVK